MAFGAGLRNGITFWDTDESRSFAHRLFHLLGFRIAAVTSSAGDPPRMVHITHKELRSLVAQRLMARQALVIRRSSHGEAETDGERTHHVRHESIHAAHPMMVRMMM
jgi:hypothetical protein